MRRSDRLRLARDAGTGIEAISACFFGHAYDLHHHEEWLVGVTERGVQDFFCRGERRQSTRGRVILIEPGEMHDGQAVTGGGFAYSMLYLPQSWLDARLAGPAQAVGFRSTLADDRRLGAAIAWACRLVDKTGPRLMIDAALDAVVLHLRTHLGLPLQDDGAKDAGSWVARRARDRLHDCLRQDVGLDALAEAAGASDRFQLARAFRTAYGTSPHAYLVQLRLAEARRLLKENVAPADAAFAAGFADQSHLGRWFRRAYGMTPAAYRRGRTNVPDVSPATG
ncbi:AraC family transcriptional regulator [Consotaella aegiceratis]|uniref:AraC family transcriptional regulator n=1 Tax=Consotaella aegiceratis TaxID=3097961 RepID=UPI002F414E2E